MDTCQLGADSMHARYYNPNVARFLSTDPVLNLKRALRQPQNWNRYTYGLNNPLKYVDPTGQDVAIRVTFVGDGWTDEMKKQVLTNIRLAWTQLNVGRVWALDAAKFGQLKGPGTANISIDPATGTSRPQSVLAGAVLDQMKKGNIDAAGAANAIANLVNHEVFTHQLGLSALPGLRDRDWMAFGLGNAMFSQDPAIAAREGTIVDSAAWQRVPGRMTTQPLPVLLDDAVRARSVLGPINLLPVLGSPDE
jgi:RHS repeat-associated protein